MAGTKECHTQWVLRRFLVNWLHLQVRRETKTREAERESRADESRHEAAATTATGTAVIFICTHIGNTSGCRGAGTGQKVDPGCAKRGFRAVTTKP